MAKITIIDTGFNTADRNGTARSGTTITNFSTYKAGNSTGQTSLTLNSASLRLRSGTNLADEPNPSSDAPARVHSTTFNNRVFDIDFIIDVQSSTDRNVLKEIAVLDRTKGIKLLYASDTNDIIKTLPEIIGRIDTNFNGNEVGSSIPIIVGRVAGYDIRQISTSRKFQISGTITFIEEKV